MLPRKYPLMSAVIKQNFQKIDRTFYKKKSRA
ncbi:unknown [[Mannheimia] succiniciproducens MBEL55E]|uniref:Uncharacterized protein n=1 Tax=Mannheimia succiniciproducens (strain KCTC 0769BP / MBEL55E) TaxID=221988 RepID=Q65TK0_MANSM|nr:unknown [[Mannheimia] succiniciproducens MBEL55E]